MTRDPWCIGDGLRTQIGDKSWWQDSLKPSTRMFFTIHLNSNSNGTFHGKGLHQYLPLDHFFIIITHSYFYRNYLTSLKGRFKASLSSSDTHRTLETFCNLEFTTGAFQRWTKDGFSSSTNQCIMHSSNPTCSKFYGTESYFVKSKQRQPGIHGWFRC